MKNTVNNTEMKMQEENKKIINDLIDEKLSWLETNTTASTEEFRDVKKEVEDVINTILQSNSGMGQPPPPPIHEEPNNEPTIEEID